MSNEPKFDPAPVIAEELGLARAGVAAVLALLGEEPRSPSSRAIARRRPPVWTRCRSAPSTSDAFIWWRCTTGAPRSSRRSRAGKAHRRSQAQDRSLPDQGRARRPLPTVQAQAPHARHHRARARARAAGRIDVGAGTHRGRRRQAARFVDAAKEVPDAAAALAGARDICAERIAENPDLRKVLREAFS